MAMKLKDALTAAPRGFLRLFSTSSTPSFLNMPTDTSARNQGEPNTNLFVSGLNKQTSTEKLREAFSKFGEVVHAKVVTDRQHGHSKGFGFVKYATLEDAAKGIEGMDGKFLDGWVIFAEYAKPRPSPAAPGNNTSATSFRSNSSYPYGNNSAPSYRNSGSSYWHSMDKDTMNTSAAYGNSASPTCGNNAYHSNNGPAYGNDNIGSVNQNTRDSGYGSNTEPVYRSNAVPGYGSNMNSSFWSNPGHAYGSNANGSATGVTHGNANNSVPMYDDVPQGDSLDPNGNRSSAYGDEVAAGRY